MKIKIKIGKNNALILASTFLVFLITLVSSGVYINSQTGVGHDLDELPPGYFPGDFEIKGNLIVNDIIVEGLPQPYPQNSLALIIANTNGSYDMQLVNGNHGVSDCLKLGGTKVQDPEDGPEDYFCRLSLSGCPSGWVQYGSWSRTTSSSCCGNNAACSSSCTSSGGHDWANIAREKGRYRSGLGLNWCDWKNCWSNVREVGCY